MPEQILSQEEIDALLSAISKGNVDLDQEGDSRSEARTYDLTSQSVMLGDQFSVLEEVYDRFTTQLKKALRSSLQTGLEVTFASSEILKFGDFIEGFGNPTGFNIFTMEPLVGSAMLTFESSLLYSLIDCMFGGDGTPLNQPKELTAVDQRMMAKMSREVLDNFANAWAIVSPIKTLIRKTETKPEFVHLAAPGDAVIVIVFAIGNQAFSGNIHLCIPYLMLEPIKDKLASGYLREREGGHVWNQQLRRLLSRVKVSLLAELGRTTQTVGDLLNLQVDDVIMLPSGPHDALKIKIEKVDKYEGFPGIVNGNRAVQIERLLLGKEGMH